MTDTLSEATSDARGRTLSTISDQLEALMSRIADDVAKYADSQIGPSGGGFVIYYLTDGDGEPLKNLRTEDQGISLNDIEGTSGFNRLRAYCERLSLRLRIDEHYYAEEPRPTRIYRVVVDGWS